MIFQSTHPRGVRLNNLVDVKLHLCISIHAPTWGATVSPVLLSALASQFQSTHPRGVRPRWPWTTLPLRYFNPRTHVGCDLGSVSTLSSGLLFQSTHPRGVRQKSTTAEQVEMQFQSTHPRGVRPTAADILPTVFEFQSTHPRGVRPSVSNHHSSWRLFQSTHPRGVRPPCVDR